MIEKGRYYFDVRKMQRSMEEVEIFRSLFKEKQSLRSLCLSHI